MGYIECEKKKHGVQTLETGAEFCSGMCECSVACCIAAVVARFLCAEKREVGEPSGFYHPSVYSKNMRW